MSLDLSRPLVYLITKGECDASNFADTSRQIVNIASAAVNADIDLIQIREKRLSGKLLFDLTQRVAAITRRAQTRVLVNDRLDIALAAGSDGVHLTSASMPADVVRARVPDGFLIGVSCHSSEEIAMFAEAADFAMFGPVFESPGKGDGVGLTGLKHACDAAGKIPVLAIGGIDASNCNKVLEAEAAGFAAIRALNDPDSMARMMMELGR